MQAKVLLRYALLSVIESARRITDKDIDSQENPSQDDAEANASMMVDEAEKPIK
jgi:hypothetical protein